MKIAVPVANEQTCMHFGHCQVFHVFNLNEKNEIVNVDVLTPPPHEPGVIPKWMGEEVKADVILAGGMGMKAQQLFTHYNIKIVTGVQSGKTPEELVKDYVNNQLVTGENACSH